MTAETDLDVTECGQLAIGVPGEQVSLLPLPNPEPTGEPSLADEWLAHLRGLEDA